VPVATLRFKGQAAPGGCSALNLMAGLAGGNRGLPLLCLLSLSLICQR